LAWDAALLGNHPCFSLNLQLTSVQAVCILAFASNVWGIRLLPSIQLMGGICHVVFFFALSVPLILLADRSTPDFVFTTLINEAGWSSDGVSWCVGLLTVTYCFMGKASSQFRRCSLTFPQASMALCT
jgi:hypothetical protein